MEKTEKVVPTGLTLRLFLIVLITVPLSFVLVMWIQTWGNPSIWPIIFPFPTIVNLILLGLLEKISPKFRLTPQEFTLMTTAFWMVSGMYWTATGVGYWPIHRLPSAQWGGFIYSAYTTPYSSKIQGTIPSFWSPTSTNVLKNFFNGGPVDWAAWLPSMTYFAVLAAALYCGSYFWGFLIRKPYIDVEELPYVLAQPSILTMKSYFGEKSDGKTPLFNLGLTSTKMIWIGFAAGFLSSFPATAAGFLPIPPIPYITDWVWNLTPNTYKFLPGANMYIRLTPAEIALGIFCPLDWLISCGLWTLLMNFIYNPIVATTGLLPYTPLVTEGPAGDFGSNQYASTVGFKWNYWTLVGMPTGFGVYVLWQYRKHFIDTFKVAFGQGKDLPKDEDGVSYRTVVIGGLICFIVVVALWTAGGMPIEVSVFSVLVFIIFNYGWTKVHALNPSNGGISNVRDWAGYAYGAGQVTGHWGRPPDPAATNSMMMYMSLGPGMHRMAGYSMMFQLGNYKIAKEMNTSSKGVLIVSILTMVLVAVFGYPFYLWWVHTMGGYNKMNLTGFGDARTAAAEWWSYTYGTPTPRAYDYLSYTISGTAVVFVCAFLRARFPWFIINPAGFVLAYHWPNMVAALVIKYVFLKVGGVRKFETYALPFGATYCLGYGTSTVISGMYVFFSRCVPEFLVRMRPV